jgi:hypothetical protein
LTFAKFPRLNVPQKMHKHFIESDHALDSLVACYCTAMYHHDKTLFADPLDANSMDVLLEGWIYTPRA